MGIEALFDPRVQQLLAGLHPEVDALSANSELRKALDPETARLATQQLELRRRARERFPQAEISLFTRRGLEQATHRLVAEDRARRIAARHPGAGVLDATAGLGGDAIALAAAGLAVAAAELDPDHARFLHWNLAAAGHPARVVRADALAPAVRAEVYLADPARRDGDRRRRDEPDRWRPPLPELLEAAARFPSACIKLPPHLDPAVVRVAGPHSWSWVSLGGDLRELTLWMGGLAEELPRRAVRIGRDGEACEFAADPAEPLATTAPSPTDEPWIAEVDPAVRAADLTDHVAARAGLARLDPEEGYLLGARPDEGLPLRTWPVLDACALDRRRVRRLLAEHDVGEVTVKKRSHPDSSDVLQRRLRGGGAGRGTLLVARTSEGYRAHLIEISPR